ncbi:MAG: hypothetical protein CM15mP45_02940 [Deltaproteobacteria bacterium]|nr:MAG: hypothetical protein CM15mP45_02940 [Deltaproteobacteria bacterium]
MELLQVEEFLLIGKLQSLDSSSGSTTFFNLNFGLGPVDLLLQVTGCGTQHININILTVQKAN